ncbi:MAG: Ig-like domain-containing domain [Ferruginibacter sp.]
MVTKRIFTLLLLIITGYAIVSLSSGCAQIGAPTGGDRDSAAPVLLRAEPENLSTNFTGNKITLSFDEYIDVQDVQQNVLISPLQKNNPSVNFNFRTVTIRFRDTLLPNTTYSIQFGNALKDLNEGNPLKDFVYIFSTGEVLDSLSFSGKIIMAETGKTDSTLVAMLYRNAADSTVLNMRPLYIARVSGSGDFTFNNLPPGNYKTYALKDGDGGKTYNSKTEAFAFLDSNTIISQNTPPVTLYAYEEIKSKTEIKTQLKTKPEKRLRYTSTLNAQSQDILKPLELTFNNSINTLDSGLVLTDTNYRPVKNAFYIFDSTRKKLEIKTTWQPDLNYTLIIPKTSILDSAGNSLLRSDTIRFKTKKSEDYGTVLFRFKNLDLSMKPVLQFIQNGEIKFSSAVTAKEWSDKMFLPGDYEIRILFDTNNNRMWDPGNYMQKLQPEKVITLPQTLSIRANWDNERDITL